MKLARALSVCLTLFAVPASGQDSVADLARLAADRLAAAQASLQAADGARNRIDALTRTIRAYEDGLAAVREGMRQAGIREAAILAEFDAKSEDLSQLLGVMMAVQTTQGPLALMHPQGPTGAARTGMIVSAVTPAIGAEAERLKARLTELATIQAIQQSASAQLQTGLTGAQTAREELAKAMSDRRDLPKRFVADEAAMSLLADNAETLGDFASGLLELTPFSEELTPVRAFRDAFGTLALPVSGQLLRRFGEADAAGIQRPGLILATRQNALVSNPWPATVRYAGPLLDYGNVIVLEPQAGLMLVFAGLDVTYVEPGQVVGEGDALGLMPGATANTDDDEMPNETEIAGSALTETLYIELRDELTPTDPAPWFAETKDKS